MKDPYITSEGITYEKNALIEHNYEGNFFPNRVIKNLIDKYMVISSYEITYEKNALIEHEGNFFPNIVIKNLIDNYIVTSTDL